LIAALLSSIYLGWSLGTNDAANIFGTAVASRMIRFTTAAVLASIFVILGACIDGYEGVHTLSSLTTQNVQTAGITAFAAALTVTLMTILKLPVSTSQGVVGSIIGVGIMQNDVNFANLYKIILCWIGTPIGAFVIAIITYLLLAQVFNRMRIGIVNHDIILKVGLVIAGCYGAYALGANNVANVTGVLAAAKVVTPFQAVVIGGVSIALGIITFSRGVMGTVGKGIVKLDAFSSLVVVIAEAITVHIYAVIGVPVSTSQAVIGAVLGIGILKRIEAIRFKAAMGIFYGWLATPIIACGLSMLCYVVLHLEYTG
jgi:PiT family inorganic phosphate transporter